ncbi:hypothetical protein Acsp04_64410 [Actinomadura sp. NBRC 104425]|uniref:WXG100 family type VII secretion target n=1 Tax=Actinomadura sp. NBRC 104425 TaxID=3032204 RepID=UPI00249FBBE0|nr:WXG100 family type VII secretion target [Actinomadura sp. NBRC 104425]GLZ16206.1 hypothetical protein Acsp04_64410 [Actinomadura sp. NBRC 104425]
MTDYDTVETLDIGPAGIKTTATEVLRLAQEIADALDRIVQSLNALTATGWQGMTQQEAEDFNNRWMEVMKALFGTKENPESGVLNAIASGIGTAGDNYDKGETGLTDIWAKFAAGLPSGDGTSDQPPSKEPPADVLDTNKTAITADY